MTDVILVRDFMEAASMGARSVKGRMEIDGQMVITAHQSPASTYGIWVGEIAVSPRAAEGRNFTDIMEALMRGQEKTRPQG